MKKYVLILMVAFIFLLTTAQAKEPMKIGGFEVLSTRTIYKIKYTLDLGNGCKETIYWYVDEWGRPVDAEGYNLKEVLPDAEILQQFFDTLPDIPNITKTNRPDDKNI